MSPLAAASTAVKASPWGKARAKSGSRSSPFPAAAGERTSVVAEPLDIIGDDAEPSAESFLSTVFYNAFGRFRYALLPKGEQLDTVM